MTHPNAELIRGGYEAFGRGDIPAVLAQFNDDIVWHVAGRNLLSGDYHGHDGVIAFFTELMELSGGTFNLSVHDITASDGHVIAIVDLTAERDGKPWANNGVHVWHLANGKVAEFRAIAIDPYLDDEFWS
ncbi:MAG: nuclear transport factor 2 family protein [Actinomycetota bacterium]|nr:nuclear transport factor 2 family protein [Actinomycetota bacterium]